MSEPMDTVEKETGLIAPDTDSSNDLILRARGVSCGNISRNRKWRIVITLIAPSVTESEKPDVVDIMHIKLD